MYFSIDNLLTVVLPIIGGVAGLISLGMNVSRHLKERSAVRFELAKGSDPFYFKIFSYKKDEWGQPVADRSVHTSGLCIEFNFINKSVHPISIYEIAIVIGGIEHLLLRQPVQYHDIDSLTFKSNVLMLPVIIEPFETIRKTLYFDLGEHSLEKIRITFHTSRKKYVRKFNVPSVPNQE
jgi:hypothetical protein